MMFSTPFEQFKIGAASKLPELPSGVPFGVNSLKLLNYHLNPSNPLSMFRASIRCIKIVHAYIMRIASMSCVDCFLSGVCLLSIERDSKVKASNANWRILDPNGQVKFCF